MSSATNFETGRKSSIGGTAVALTAITDVSVKGVQIVASAGNTGNVYVGNSDAVTADGDDDTDGFQIAAGNSVLIPIRQPTTIYVIADSGSDNKVWFLLV